MWKYARFSSFMSYTNRMGNRSQMTTTRNLSEPLIFFRSDYCKETHINKEKLPLTRKTSISKILTTLENLASTKWSWCQWRRILCYKPIRCVELAMPMQLHELSQSGTTEQRLWIRTRRWVRSIHLTHPLIPRWCQKEVEYSGRQFVKVEDTK